MIGSRMGLSWLQDSRRPPRLIRLWDTEMVTDGLNKPIAILQVLGRRQVLAFGNTDGDLPMLEWSTAGSWPRPGFLVHHTDARREWAYDRDSRIGRLNQGLDRARERGWILVDMVRDCLQVDPRQLVSP
ncbi:MAG: hypothetical protein ACKO0M_13075 [Cyanobium sp.]